MEETIMKKISQNEALCQLKHGFYPKCEVDRDILKPVRNPRDVENFVKLSSVQKCQFYGYDREEVRSFVIPENGLEISVDEATEMIMEGEKIYARILGEKDEQTFADVNSFVAFIKKCNINGDNILLYWYE